MSDLAVDDPADLLQCVVNVSEGCERPTIAYLAAAGGDAVLDVHSDVHHNRSVFTLAGPARAVETAVRRLAAAAVATIDITGHRGVHPRLGALDVVPWVHLSRDEGGRLHDGPIQAAVAARDRFAHWAGTALDLPCFTYGPGDRSVGEVERTLPQLRRDAWTRLLPAAGPPRPHPTAGAACVGARPALVAYNLWLDRPDLQLAQRIARDIRSPQLRALGLDVGGAAQVSCNLIAPWSVGPAAVFDAVASRSGVQRAELVGLVPISVLEAIPSSRWSLLDVDGARTIEARLERAGLDGGRFDGGRFGAPG